MNTSFASERRSERPKCFWNVVFSIWINTGVAIAMVLTEIAFTQFPKQVSIHDPIMCLGFIWLWLPMLFTKYYAKEVKNNESQPTYRKEPSARGEVLREGL